MHMKTFSTCSIRELRLNLLSSLYLGRSCRQHLGVNSVPWGIARHGLHSHSKVRTPSRHVSSVSPVTAVDVPRTIPASYKVLYEELSALKKAAAEYVNLSQLELAQRSLESEDPVIRIAVLGLNGHRGPVRLIRTLLADPLGSEQPWERQFSDGEETDTRALLIRFGEEYDFQQQNPLLQTLSIPSTFLRNNKTELLVYSLDTGGNDGSAMSNLDAQDVLVPVLNTPASASGRASAVTYPVHKALLYGENIQSIPLMPAKVMLSSDEKAASLIRGSVDTSWRSSESDNRSNQPIILVNLEQAELAIKSFRASLENSFDYEHNWLASNFPAVDDFLIAGMTPRLSQSLKPVLRTFISVLLSNAASAITLACSKRLSSVSSSAVTEATRADLSKSITQWAEDAHTELHDGLAFAFGNSAWRRTAWWKLLWRVDDIGFIASQTLQESFLIEAEKSAIWIAGRMQQAGLLPEPNFRIAKEFSDSQMLRGKPQQGRVNGVIPSPAVTRQELYDVTVNKLHIAALQNIGQTRADLLRSVPTLQVLSQTLLLQSISTTAITSALSALLYVSIHTTSLYEAAAIGTLGFVWSTRRLQRAWEEARKSWVDRVKEEGRLALSAVEVGCRAIVKNGGKSVAEPQPEEIEEKIAEEAVARAKQVLDKMQ